ncbi:unnamed protein product [Blepharisma stoltei]|uniref:Uncharacterized protein n=1 Tax=Blepharisma stoltei TaxID=1481888 RepID=A0AAU9JSF6_9CILI|nr:unnamed protein product [Blepharisma stoltei]
MEESQNSISIEDYRTRINEIMGKASLSCAEELNYFLKGWCELDSHLTVLKECLESEALIRSMSWNWKERSRRKLKAEICTKIR